MLVRVSMDCFGDLCLVHFLERMNDKMHVFSGVDNTWSVIEEGDMLPPTPFMLEQPAVVVLMNELWKLGFRPSSHLYNGNGNAEELAALREHLRDAREVNRVLLTAVLGKRGEDD